MPSHNLSAAPSLLLLPSPPEPATAESVRVAYYAPLESVLSRLSCEHKSSTSWGVGPVLVIAIASPILKPDGSNRWLVCWQRSQALLAHIYSLIAVICAKKSIATDLEADDPGAVDSRVVLVDHSRVSERLYKPNSKGSYDSNNTAVLDLAAFASAVYPWNRVFYSSCERGHELVAAFLRYSEGHQQLQHKQLVGVEGGLSFSKQVSDLGTIQSGGNSHSGACDGYSIVCLGGTFDHLHPGHKLFLHAAVLLLDARKPGAETGQQCQLVIGVSSDQLLAKKKYSEELQSWDVRARSVLNFLSSLLSTSTIESVEMKVVSAETKELHAFYRNDSILVRCVDFHDVYGPTVKEEAIEALVVSGETRSGGDLVNERRRSQGWSMLDVYEIDVLDARLDSAGMNPNQPAIDNFAGKISSTEIRRQKAEGRGTS